MKTWLSDLASQQLDELAQDKGLRRRFKAVNKAIQWLQTQGPRYPGLNSHKYKGVTGPNGEDMWESYAQNSTPGAFRIFWYFPRKSPNSIVISSIEKHP